MNLLFEEVALDGGFRIIVTAENPDILFKHFDGNGLKILSFLENACNEFVSKKEYNTAFTLPIQSFLSKEIYIIREYSF